MRIVKRNGAEESVDFNKILTRIQKASNDLTFQYRSIEELAKDVISFLADGVSSAQIDETIANIAENWSTKEPNYEILAKNIIVSRHHKEYIHDLIRLKRLGLITEELEHKWNKFNLNAYIKPDLDYKFTFFGFSTLAKKYLLKYPDGILAETPQHLYMRVAATLFDTQEDILKSYYYQSHHFYTHASPTLFHAGTPLGQLASCFLLGTSDDIDGLYQTVKECGNISKHAGGIGLHATNVRAKGSYIHGTGGRSNGLVPYLKVLEATANMCDQGGGRRKGAFSVYLEPWHADIEDFIDACKKTGEGRNRAKDLFYALWVPDEFMRAVKEDDYWYLFCPNEVPSLLNCHGEDWLRNYNEAIEKQQYRKKLKARTLMQRIVALMLEEGKIYFLYKDTANNISPQTPLGTIKSSNLCAEIILYSDENTTSVCNLASLNLRLFGDPEFTAATRFAVRSLDRVIDVNEYPDEKTKNSNMYLRPIGLGVQGLADYWMDQGIDWLSDKADSSMHEIMKEINEATHAESRLLGEELGIPEGCSKIGVERRNSVLLALMPTASTSQVLGNQECFEPVYQNIYRRRTGVDDFIVVNYRLVRDLQKLGKWSNLVYSSIYQNNGSVQHLDIPEELKAKYRTVFEIGPKRLIELAAIRQQYIDQSQSMNLYYYNPNTNRVIKALMYAWEKGLVTGTYYTRTLSSGQAQVMEDCESCSA